MVRPSADEDFDRDILKGLLRRRPDIDLPRVQEAGLRGADDPSVLAWTADEGRVLLTHDRKTMPPFAYDRTAADLAMPRVVVVSRKLSVGEAIEAILELVGTTPDSEWEDRVLHLPRR